MKKIFVLLLFAFGLGVASAQDDPNAVPANLNPAPIVRFRLNPRRAAIFHRFWLYPGQELVVVNATFWHVHVVSDLPVSVRASGLCSDPDTNEITCDIMPNLDIHILDIQSTSSGKMNGVYVTVDKSSKN